jgi:hypothetical protein
VVVTATTGTHTHNALLKRKWQSLVLMDFNEEGKEELAIKFMQNRSKTLAPPQLKTIVAAKQTAFPLYLKAVLEELVVFGEYEKLDAHLKELLQVRIHSVILLGGWVVGWLGGWVVGADSVFTIGVHLLAEPCRSRRLSSTSTPTRSSGCRLRSTGTTSRRF